MRADVASLHATVTGKVPRKVGAAVKTGVAKVAAKVPTSTVAKMVYGASAGAAGAIQLAPHVVTVVHAVVGWLCNQQKTGSPIAGLPVFAYLSQRSNCAAAPA